MVEVMRIDVTQEAARFEPGSARLVRNVMSVCTVGVDVFQNACVSLFLLRNLVSRSLQECPKLPWKYVAYACVCACSIVVLEEMRVWDVFAKRRVFLVDALREVDYLLVGKEVAVLFGTQEYPTRRFRNLPSRVFRVFAV